MRNASSSSNKCARSPTSTPGVRSHSWRLCAQHCTPLARQPSRLINAALLFAMQEAARALQDNLRNSEGSRKALLGEGERCAATTSCRVSRGALAPSAVPRAQSPAPASPNLPHRPYLHVSPAPPRPPRPQAEPAPERGEVHGGAGAPAQAPRRVLCESLNPALAARGLRAPTAPLVARATFAESLCLHHAALGSDLLTAYDHTPLTSPPCALHVQLRTKTEDLQARLDAAIAAEATASAAASAARAAADAAPREAADANRRRQEEAASACCPPAFGSSTRCVRLVHGATADQVALSLALQSPLPGCARLKRVHEKPKIAKPPHASWQMRPSPK
eukprot:scaffold83988_cov28-Tisochrysis_lutea.AAC.6